MKIPAQTALHDADYTRTLRRMMVPNGFTPADLAIPGNWANIWDKVKVDDEVIVFDENRTWRLHLLVTHTERGLVKTALIHSLELAAPVVAKEEPGEELPVPAGYKVNHAPKTLWRVLTEDPAMEISRNHKTRREATMAAIAHAAKASGLAA